MAHLLHRLGARALLPRRDGDKILPPLIAFQDALKLREQYYAIGQPWPYENIVPGQPKPPPGTENYLARRKEREEKRAVRRKAIADAMSAMPKLIADYKALRKLDMNEVSPLDKMLMTPSQLKEKYVRKRLLKQN